MTMPRLKRLVAGLSPRRPGFAPGSIHVGFVVDKVALGRFSPSTSVSPANIIPPLLHIHLSPTHEVCDRSDQAAHYHNLGPQLGASDPAHWLETEIESKKKKESVHYCNPTLNVSYLLHSYSLHPDLYFLIFFREGIRGADSRSRILLRKLTATQLVKKYSAFMESKCSLPFSQDPAIVTILSQIKLVNILPPI
jgi:hypothetical protein